jgi:hypothetical protein
VGVHDWLRTGSDSVGNFPAISHTESMKSEAILSRKVQESCNYNSRRLQMWRVAARDMSSVATEDTSSVATEDVSSVATEDRFCCDRRDVRWTWDYWWTLGLLVDPETLHDTIEQGLRVYQ